VKETTIVVSAKNFTDRLEKMGNTVMEHIEMQNITAEKHRFNEIMESINRFFSAGKNSTTTNFFAAIGWETYDIYIHETYDI